MKPRIAIPHPNSRADYVAKVLPQYARAVEQAGGEPFAIALHLSNEEIARLASLCHAVLLPGSPTDVDPEKYGDAVRHPKTAAADPARDNLDELLLQDAFNMRKPVLGICYGLQSLNVWRTGTLLQHLEYTPGEPAHEAQHRGVRYVVTPINHPAGSKIARAHSVSVEPKSQLAAIVGASALPVNSSHHQSVAIPGDGLRAVARCPEDGVIEAVEGTEPNHFVLGVQWHPERMVDDDAAALALFRALVQAAEMRFHDPRAPVPDFESLAR